MQGNTGTPTDPFWSYVVAALFLAFAVLTLFAIVDSVLRVLIRQAQQRRAMRRWCEDVQARSPIGGGLR